MSDTREMFRVMRLIQRGGFKMPRYRHRNWRGWNEACYRGYVGEGRDGFEVLTRSGRLALAQIETQQPLRVEDVLMQIYNPYSFAR